MLADLVWGWLRFRRAEIWREDEEVLTRAVADTAADELRDSAAPKKTVGAKRGTSMCSLTSSRARVFPTPGCPFRNQNVATAIVTFGGTPTVAVMTSTDTPSSDRRDTARSSTTTRVLSLCKVPKFLPCPVEKEVASRSGARIPQQQSSYLTQETRIDEMFVAHADPGKALLQMS